MPRLRSPSRYCRSAWGWRVPTGDVARRDFQHVGAGMSGLFGPVGSARQSRGQADVAVAIRNEPVILRRERSADRQSLRARLADSVEHRYCRDGRGLGTARESCAGTFCTFLEELNDGDKIEVVRREIASQVDRSVQGHGGAKQEQGGCSQQEEEREACRENHHGETKERAEGRRALQRSEKGRRQTARKSHSQETVSRNSHQARSQHGTAPGRDRGKAKRRGSRTIGRRREGSRHDLSRPESALLRAGRRTPSRFAYEEDRGRSASRPVCAPPTPARAGCAANQFATVAKIASRP
jgi:hypothetical protein